MRWTLRWEKVDTIVRKEMAEFRKNRYILISLFAMPLLMSTILPLVYLVPITTFVTPPAEQPLDLRIQVEGLLADQQLVNVSIQNYRIQNADLQNCAITSCEIVDCSLRSCVIKDCNITGSQVQSSIVGHSNIWTSSVVDSLTMGSLFLGVESESEMYLKLFVNSLLMFFVLIPTVIPTVIASYSFVGEKLSKSLEPLLATPTSDLELLVGKTMAILLPTMAVTWLSLIPTVIITDLVTEPILGYYILPNDIWLAGVFIVAPLFGILSVLINVIISSKVTDVRSSQQIGGVIVLPAIAFFIIALAGLVILSVVNMLLFAAMIFALDVLVLYLAIKAFRREEILVRWR